ncbi:MAG: cobyric acid synthase, partial [Gammaproteobacteria bacterium]|nr:cobyric acid synthase [Gammaproteobacteria bacterium]
MTTPALMLQGTGSDVGKSLLCAGLCRVFSRRGLDVRPFKPQNMSNNAAVTADGGEIGRAQALQAMACGVAPSVDMNPVLLKPERDMGAQVVVHGKRVATLGAREYFARKPELMAAVLESYARLGAQAELVLIEGAGSAAEANLRAHDIANMGFAERADVPVVLIADIDRGGVIASLVGSHALLAESERARVRGYVINRFRGDVRLFDDGLEIITDRTGWPSLGIVPFLPAAGKLPAEDSVVLDRRTHEARPSETRAELRIAVLELSRIANHDDFDPLRLEPNVALSMVRAGDAIPGDAQLVIIPGTKSTLGDLDYLRAQGWDVDLYAHLRRGGRVLGICGGYQMLGERLSDPDGLEGRAGSVDGLGLLRVDTTLGPEKRLENVSGTHLASGAPVAGYEMHLGITEGEDCARAFVDLGG